MLTRRQGVGLSVVVAVGAVAAIRIAMPGRVGMNPTEIYGQVTTVVSDLPEPVVLAGTFLLAVSVWVLGMWLLAKVLYRIWQRIGGRVKWAVDLVVPESPIVRFATGVMVFLALVVVIIGALPTLVGNLSESTEGPAGLAQGLEDSSSEGVSSVVDEGPSVGSPACDGQDVAGPDSDGDGLPDAWERAGETPDGTPLPGADPQHKDLYVQVNHGTNVDGLSDSERRDLRRVWAQMPVENPDGTDGITLHVDDSSARAGSLEESVVFTSTDDYDRFYSPEIMGDRRCVYHQVTYGRMDIENVGGFGSLSGYSVIVDGRHSNEYDGETSLRVAMTTHELLHNVAGRVDGQTHTAEGWLSTDITDRESLSAATTRHINQTGLFGPAH